MLFFIEKVNLNLYNALFIGVALSVIGILIMTKKNRSKKSNNLPFEKAIKKIDNCARMKVPNNEISITEETNVVHQRETERTLFGIKEIHQTVPKHDYQHSTYISYYSQELDHLFIREINKNIQTVEFILADKQITAYIFYNTKKVDDYYFFISAFD